MPADGPCHSSGGAAAAAPGSTSNDGSGGIREVKRNDRWVNDAFDNGLTLKK